MKQQISYLWKNA